MSMVQYGLWSNCTNRCDFCLLRERDYISKEEQLHRLKYVKNNLDYVDWDNQFKDGISLLGGELYGITDKEIQESFLELIDKIIEKIIKPHPQAFYSTVTNGIYNPEFLFKVIDKFDSQGLINQTDTNFSYDLKYRFHTEQSRLLCIENIKKYNQRYTKPASVQMILTQNLINEYNSGNFEFNSFRKEVLGGASLYLLYPHKVRTGKVLTDFNFNRHDLIKFVLDIKQKYPDMCSSFILSVINSSKFKYTGYYVRDPLYNESDYSQQPVLDEDKSDTNPECGHSTLYQCYADCNRCMLCDIEEMLE